MELALLDTADYRVVSYRAAPRPVSVAEEADLLPARGGGCQLPDLHDPALLPARLPGRHRHGRQPAASHKGRHGATACGLQGDWNEECFWLCEADPRFLTYPDVS